MEKNFLKNEKTQHLLVCLFFMIISIMILFKSSSNPWARWDYGKDSAAFKTIAVMMNNGFMPWRDTFDHKGPLMYIINYVGYLISPSFGIWIVELPFMFVTLIGMYMIARLKTGKLASIVTSLVSASLLFDFLGDGNYSEEYALPFITIAIYIFLDYLLNEKVSKLRLAVCGGTMGCVLLLRPNMISVWIVFCLVIFVRCLVLKQWKEIRGFIIFFLLGIAVALLPSFVWMAATGTLNACWQSYIVFNQEYVVNMAGENLNRDRFVAFMCFLKHIVELIAIAACIYLAIIREHLAYLSSLLAIFFSLVMLSMSGMQYDHYGIVLIPCLAFPIAGAFNECARLFKWKLKKPGGINIMASLMAIFLIGITASKWGQLGNIINTSLGDSVTNTYSDDVKTATALVNENTGEKDKISVYGNWDIIYLLSNRLHSTRYSYQFPIGDVSTVVLDEYFGQLMDEQPRIIVVEKEHMDDRMSEYLLSNEYTMLWEGSSDDERNGAMVWKKSM